MRVALAVLRGRISPVFDYSQRLLVADVEAGKEVSEREEALLHTFTPQRVSRLRQLGIHTLICGAVSQPLAALIAASGIRLIPFVAGEVRAVLQAFLAGGLPSNEFLMPGCGRAWRGRRGRGGRRFRRGRGSW